MIKWLIWVIVAALLVFGGWAIMGVYSALWGRFLMSLGWLLFGFLLIFYCLKTLK